MKLSELTLRMIAVTEKAAAIAKAIRCEHALFELLVEKKIGFAKNNRFVDDFKTLADVLIQEMVRHDLSIRVSLILIMQVVIIYITILNSWEFVKLSELLGFTVRPKLSTFFRKNNSRAE